MKALFKSKFVFAGIPLVAKYRLYRGDEGVELEFESVATPPGDEVEIEFSVNDGALGEEIERVLRARITKRCPD